MPELPEVETIRRGLEKYLVGHIIKDIEIRKPNILYGRVEDVINAKVTGARRFGKALVIDLDNNFSLAIHVKMTGQLIYRKEKKDDLPHKFTHIVFNLDHDSILFYNDIRRFGWIKIMKTEEIEKMKFIQGLGHEMLKDLTQDIFKNILKGKKTNIKTLLMDQTKIAGIGNIYANDALFLAGINPKRTAESLSDVEQSKLFSSLEEVLMLGIKHGGSSENTYVNALGEKGSYQEHSPIYGKTGQPCPNCGAPIKRITIGGRGTFFCNNCQK